MTKDEIKKALECCISKKDGMCKHCPNYDYKHEDCMDNVKRHALNLITEQDKEIEQMKATGYHKVEKVYIILSPEGGIALNICTGKGTFYTDKAKAEDALKRKNEWSKIKGYGVYKLVELEVEE